MRPNTATFLNILESATVVSHWISLPVAWLSCNPAWARSRKPPWGHFCSLASGPDGARLCKPALGCSGTACGAPSGTAPPGHSGTSVAGRPYILAGWLPCILAWEPACTLSSALFGTAALAPSCWQKQNFEIATSSSLTLILSKVQLGNESRTFSTQLFVFALLLLSIDSCSTQPFRTIAP